MRLDKRVLILLFFPSVTFGLIGAEIFPWPLLIISVLILFSKTKSAGLVKSDFAVLIFFLLSTVSYLLFHQEFLNESVRSLASFFNPFVAFILLRKYTNDEIYILCKKIFIFFIIVILVQLSGLFNFGIVNEFLRIFVPRGSWFAHSEFGGRGYQLFSSEPSRASMEFVFMLMILNRRLSHFKQLFLTLITLATIIVYFKSFTGLGLLLLYILVNYSTNIKVVIGISAVILILLYVGIDSRLFQIVNLVGADIDLMTIYLSISDLSGFRIVSLEAAYRFALENIFGGGIGSWQYSSFLALENLNYSPNDFAYFRELKGGHWVPIRPVSYFAGLALEVGLLGIVLFLFALIRSTNNRDKLFYLGLGSLFFIGSIGNPFVFLLLSFYQKKICLKSQ